jgi:hypothetical protein
LSDMVRGVGFDRKIQLAWLDAVAGWTASGMPDAEIRAKLDLLLEGEVKGKEARKKTKTVLLRTWLPLSSRPVPSTRSPSPSYAATPLLWPLHAAGDHGDGRAVGARLGAPR